MITYFSPSSAMDEENSVPGSANSISSKRRHENAGAAIRRNGTENEGQVNVTTRRRSKSRMSGLSHGSSRTNATSTKNQQTFHRRNGKSNFAATKSDPVASQTHFGSSFWSSENAAAAPKIIGDGDNGDNGMALDGTPPDTKRQRFVAPAVPPLAINEAMEEDQQSEEHDVQGDGRKLESLDTGSDMDVSEGEETSLGPINPEAEKVMVHPASVPVPPKAVIKSLFKTALASNHPRVRLEKEQNNDTQVKFETITTATTTISDQRYLAPAGILSFDQVLLPAIAIQEEKLLKKMQSKVQRDAPEYKKSVERSRVLVRKSVLAAVRAIEGSRKQLYLQQEQKRRERAIKKRLARDARAVTKAQEFQRQESEKKRQQEIRAAEKKKQMQREFPKNQDLWREVILLTSSISQLEKEERMWIAAEQALIEQQDENEEPAQFDAQDTTNSSEVVTIRVEKDPAQEDAEQTMQDIVLSSTRIQQGLSAVQNILKESESVQNELFAAYQKDHLFHGYQGVENPKGLIRFLSQD